MRGLAFIDSGLRISYHIIAVPALDPSWPALEVVIALTPIHLNPKKIMTVGGNYTSLGKLWGTAGDLPLDSAELTTYGAAWQLVT